MLGIMASSGSGKAQNTAHDSREAVASKPGTIYGSLRETSGAGCIRSGEIEGLAMVKPGTFRDRVRRQRIGSHHANGQTTGWWFARGDDY